MNRKPGKATVQNGLTGIPSRIHCPATTDSGGLNDDLVQMQIAHFNQTLARIALAVAARAAGKDGE